MAGLDVAGSIVGIVGILGQITQGCLFLDGLIRDIKDAPREAQHLKTELDHVTTSVTGLRRLYERIDESRTGSSNTTTDVVEALRYCDDVVSDLVDSLRKSLYTFEDHGSTISASARTSWRRLRHALRQDATKKKLDTLSRARLSLLSIQSNIELELINQQTSSHQSLSHSINNLQSDITMTKHSLFSVEETTKRSAEIYIDTRQTSRDILSEVSALKTTFGDSLVSLQDHVSASSLDSEHSSQSLKREILQQIDAGFSTQAEMQAQAHPLLLAGISQLLDAALKKDRETYSGKNPPPGIDKPFASSSLQTRSPKFPIAMEGDKLSASETRGAERIRRNKLVSYVTYRTPICNIVIQTLRPHWILGNFDAEGDAAGPISIRKVDVQLRLGVMNRSLEFTRTYRKFDLVSQMSLRTRNIVDGRGRACEAVRAGDLDTIKNMFENKEASIMDIVHIGVSYLHLACMSILSGPLSKEKGPDNERNFIKVKNMITFLIDSGMHMENHPALSPIFNILMSRCWSGQWTLHEEVIIQDIMRGALARAEDGVLDELSDVNFDRHNMQRPLAQLFLQHKLFHGNDNAVVELEDEIFLFENKRTMILDPHAKRLKSILAGPKQPRYVLHYVDQTCHPEYMIPYSNYSALFELLDSYSLETRVSCLNRLVLFLQVLLREPGLGIEGLMWAQDGQGTGRMMTVTQFAHARGVSELLEEALRLTGHNDFDIMHLSDEYSYCGVPELLDGEVWYQTRKEWWKEVKAAIYVEGTAEEEECCFSRTYLKSGSTHQLLINAMNTAYFIFLKREGRVPGDWESVEGWTMSSEDKAELDEKVARFERAAGFLSTEHGEERSEGEIEP